MEVSKSVLETWSPETRLWVQPDQYSLGLGSPSALTHSCLHVTLEVVCINDSFDNYLWIKKDFIKNLKESC